MGLNGLDNTSKDFKEKKKKKNSWNDRGRVWVYEQIAYQCNEHVQKSINRLLIPDI